MQSIVMTCDSHVRLIPGFAHQWVKYAGWKITLVCETVHPENLPDCFELIVSVGKGEWSERLIRYLESINDDMVLLLLDDYYLYTPVDKAGVNSANFAMRWDLELDKIDLSGDRLNFLHRPLADLPAFVQSSNNADYLTSTQAALWRRRFLLSTLRADEDIWNYEVHGTERIKGQPNLKIYGQRQPSFYYQNVIERGDFTNWRRDCLTPMDVEELQTAGMWGIG